MGDSGGIFDDGLIGDDGIMLQNHINYERKYLAFGMAEMVIMLDFYFIYE